MMLLWLGVALCAVMYWLYRRSIQHLLVADTMFPGPTCVPILGNALEFLGNSQDFVGIVRRWCFLYRRSFRVWIGNRLFISIFDEKYTEVVLSSNSHIDKSQVYEFLLPWIGDGLLTSTGSKWRKHRKILTPGFHFKILESFIPVFNKNGHILCQQLAQAGQGGKVLDATYYLKLYALDNICETAMGTEIHAQLKPDSDYVQAIKAVCRIVFKRSMHIWLRPDIIFNLTADGKIHRWALTVIHGLTQSVIQNRRKEKERLGWTKTNPDTDEFNIKERRAFLDILLESAEEQNLTDKDIQEEVDTFMFEGHDTVTSALSFAVYLLATNPECQERAAQEQEDIFGSEERTATMADLQEMKYLEMVIKETLRMFPSVPFVGRCMAQDMRLDEITYIPAGAQVIVGIAALHHNSTLWDDPFTFNPERFNPEESAKRHPFSYVPFSAGPRNCIGQRYALLELKCALSDILRRFKVLPSPHHRDAPRLAAEVVLISTNGIRIVLEDRRKDLQVEG